jgi:hypothetical protein
MTFTVESKSQLAKLLATENLTIEHQKIQTAKFDPKNRVLYCPIWKDMSGALYDLLMGHEVGHALYTPAEGWHDAVSNRGHNFKGFLNVVEDARIEKKIKRKYPGIRQSFIKGYQSLLDRDFFGIKFRDVNKLSFIDRLNIYTKSGGTMPIDFTDEEQDLVNQVELCESWEDVLRVTQTVFNYSKDEQFETQKQMFMPSEDGEYELGDEEMESDDMDSNGEPEDADSDEEMESDDTDSDDGSESDEQEDDSSENQKSSNSDDGDNEEGFDYDARDDFEPTCETDDSFRNKETELLNENCKPFVYAKIPKVNLDNLITPAKIVHRSLTEYYVNERPLGLDSLNEDVKKFKTKNDRYISLLAKEFEMKKAARSYSKAKVATTGDIDISKIYKYKVDDNIFRKMTRLPKGKSHGLVLLLDCSGSMRYNMGGSIEQILVLTMFCRKVNIPFVVYGFSDADNSRRFDFLDQPIKPGFVQEENALRLQQVFLREYMNSKMSSAEFNTCIRNMVALRNSYERHTRTPMSESMGNTPLIQAMIALEPITKEFRKINNLDLVNLVIVHDGDADTSDYVCEKFDSKDEQDDKFYSKRFSAKSENVYLRDRNNSKLQIKVDSYINDSHYNIDESLRVAIFKWFSQVTGAKIFGFFITESGRNVAKSIANKYYDEKGRIVKQICNDDYKFPHWQYYRSEFVSSMCKKLKNDKFIQSYNPGYEAFFIMPGGSDLSIGDEEMEITGNVTSNKLKTAFLKMNKKRQVNRIMVSRFIDGIAA